MRWTIGLSLCVFVSGIVAQDVSNLPPCGQTCVENELGQAPEFGCSATDAACLCQNADFGYGIRDCANEACPDPSDASSAIAWAVSFCEAAGVTVASSSTATKSSPASASHTASNTVSSPSSSPLSSLTTASSTNSASVSSPTTSSPSPSSSPASSTKSHGLSSSAKIAIAAAVPCGVLGLAIIVIGVYLYGRRKGQKAERERITQPPHTTGPTVPEMDGAEIRRLELETHANRIELPEKTGLQLAHETGDETKKEES